MDKFLDSGEIGWKIKKLRQNTGLTQENLAEMIGVTFQQIQKYESGKTKLNTDKLQQVAMPFPCRWRPFSRDKPTKRRRFPNRREN
ncbi:MAG: helix-turn-helix transcriptional regulator [Geobacteraceae bacterium]